MFIVCSVWGVLGVDGDPVMGTWCSGDSTVDALDECPVDESSRSSKSPTDKTTSPPVRMISGLLSVYSRDSQWTVTLANQKSV